MNLAADNLPPRPGWESLVQLPKADSDYLQERQKVVGDEGRFNYDATRSASDPYFSSPSASVMQTDCGSQ